MAKGMVRVRPNVLCMERSVGYVKGVVQNVQIDTQSRSIKDVIERLSYWDLLSLSEVAPLRFNYDRDNLTERQRAERDAFIRPGVRGAWSDSALEMFKRFKPMPATPTLGRKPPEKKRCDTITLSDHIQDTTPTTVAVRDPASVQDDVIFAPYDRNMIVLAPPGTGKTYALIERLRHLLMSNATTSPNTEIVVLSFTRAAVAEIIKRVSGELALGAQDNLRYVNVRTFDSFATTILRKVLDRERLAPMTYEERIESLVALLRRGDKLDDTGIDEIRILIVDEIQDLVGIRARMVCGLARRVIGNNGAVMLFGDPAQAIYDYQTKDEQDPYTSTVFMQDMRSLLPRYEEVRFTTFFRYKNTRMRDFVNSAVQAMGEGVTPSGMHIERLLESLGSNKDMDDLIEGPPDSKTTAILTRSNTQAYEASLWAANHNIDAVVHRGASGAFWPGWLARLFGGFTQDKMSLEKARLRWKEYVEARTPQWTFEQAVALLRDLGAIVNNVVDLIALSRAVEQRTYLPTHTGVSKSPVVISTIHRSKGLEYDRVYLLEPSGQWQGKDEEIRVVYVAATRARRDIALLTRDKSVFRHWKRQSGGRDTVHWFRQHNGKYFVFVNGTDLISWPSIVNAADPSVQSGLWNYLAGRAGALHIQKTEGQYEVCFPLRQENATQRWVPIGRLEPQASRDFELITRDKVRGGSLPVLDLASEVLGEEHIRASAFLGPARLVLVPVLWGEAILET